MLPNQSLELLLGLFLGLVAEKLIINLLALLAGAANAEKSFSGYSLELFPVLG